MRKNTARHILHALLDLLPVLTIPIFAIYITNHDPEPISITAETQEVVDFNQKVSSEDLRDDFTSNGLTFTASGETFLVTGDNTNTSRYQWYTTNYITLDNTHIYYVSSFNTGDIDYLTSRIVIFYNDNSISYPQLPYRVSNAKSIRYYLQNEGTSYDYNFSIQFQLFDLTQMYGAGNEPTSSEFLADFPNNFYEYTLSDFIVLDVTQVLYNDTDIGSQYIYQLYHVTDKYFNMGNVFNLGNVYEWFNVNIFYGQSPFVMSIVYNIIVYEFVMDLLFLLYGLFMWFVDMLKRLIEKPIDSIK